MKVLKTVLAAAVTVTLLFSQVLAVESPVKGDGPKIVSAITSSGEDITDQDGAGNRYKKRKVYI